MASRKRSRDLSDVDGEVEVESASSSFRHSGNTKRSRVTLARERGGSVVSDDEEEVNGYLDQDEVDDSAAPLPTYDHMQRDDDAVDLQATQWVAKQMREFQENTASEQGVIEEVFCRNFMCHSKLRIKLGPLINFIIGHNGSGKSAVLTALTMCLGGKASATNRGASLKSLIKEGEESATLSVKIKNQGEGAYKPDVYGDSIIVERNFTRSGTSGFKIKSGEGKIMSTKKADLDDILDFFAFQLDNPINVLTQDMARQFLSNSTPSDKYKFFIRGTQLEVLDADYKLMEEHLDSIEAKLHSREEDIDILRKKADEANDRKQRSERTERIIQKIDALQRQHAWAQVEEQEDVLKRYQVDVERALEHIEEKIEAAKTVEGEFEGHNQAYESAQRVVQDQQEQLRPLTDAHAAEKELFDRIKSELQEKVSEERVIKNNVTSAKKTQKKLEKDIETEQTRLAEAEGPEHSQRLQELEDLKAVIEERKQEQSEHEESLADLERAKTEAQEELKQGQQRHDQAKEVVDKADGRLRALQQNQGREFAGYPDKMADLVRAVNNETRWRSKPAGPMGRHIRIRKPEWTSQIEKTLGGNLEAFVVTCKEDQALLSEIMRRIRCTSSIFIGHGGRLDTTGKEPVEAVDTILRVLDVDNDLVRNSLIINQAAEQIALIPEREKAERFMYGAERPRNVKAVMAFAGRTRREAVRFEFSGRGAEKSSHVPEWQGQPRMRTNLEEQTEIQREQLRQATNERDQIKQNMNNLQNAFTKATELIKRFHKKRNDLKTAFQQAEDAVQCKEAEIDSNQPQDGKLQELERQLSEAKDDHNAQAQSFLDMVNVKDELNSKQRQVKDRLDIATTDLAQGNERVAKAEQRLRNLENTRVDALQRKNEALEQIDDEKRIHNELEGKTETQQSIVANFVENAEKVSRRIPIEDGLTCDIIDKRIAKFIQDRERAEREAGGTIEELTLAYLKAKNEYEEAKAQTQGMQSLAKVRLH